MAIYNAIALLLAAWVDEEERLFEFSEVIYQGPSNLPTLKTL